MENLGSILSYPPFFRFFQWLIVGKCRLLFVEEYIRCKKIERCLQIFGVKVLDQFFLWCETSDAFVGFYPVIKVDETPQFVLPVG